MRAVRVVLTLSLALLAIAAGCGGSPESKDAAPAPASTPTPAAPQDAAAAAAKSMEQMTKGLQQMGQGSAKAVDFEQLVALLPEAAGWTRSKPKGEQISMGVTMSRAEAQYEKGEASIDLEITDSSFNQLLLSPMTMYLATGYSERSTEGYRKAAAVAGHPGFETWNTESKRAEITVVVSNRFVVVAKGHNVDNADQVRALVQAVDFSRLAALK